MPALIHIQGLLLSCINIICPSCGIEKVTDVGALLRHYTAEQESQQATGPPTAPVDRDALRQLQQ